MNSPFKIGDRVVIQDHTEAHGDLGVIDAISPDAPDELIIVKLDSGYIWFVDHTEISRIDQ